MHDVTPQPNQPGHRSNHFAVAHAAAKQTAVELTALDLPASTIADALIEVGLALWAADVDRLPVAKELLRQWAEVRDGD